MEAIAKRSGHEASPALISMIERAQTQGTAHLPALIADLRDPNRRAERLKQGAQAAVAGAWPLPRAEPGATAAAEARAAEPAAAPGGRADPARAGAGASARARGAASSAARAGRSATAATPGVSPRHRPPKPEPGGPEDGRRPRRKAGGGFVADRPFPGPPAAPEGGEGLSAEELYLVLEDFPDGWARRRALLEILRSGAPAALEDALALVEALGSERDRAWCLGALADERPLSARDREALLAAVPTPAARRRLEAAVGGGVGGYPTDRSDPIDPIGWSRFRAAPRSAIQ